MTPSELVPRIDRLEAVSETTLLAVQQLVAVQRQDREDFRAGIQDVVQMIGTLAQQMADMQSQVAEIQSQVAEIQSEVRGLQTENRRILEEIADMRRQG
ncbi:MAG: hypothetical protein F6K19_37285 [Cyanothece sp. SIO1E1]|nr:hypothetical protein [Cyanothece sp. SIO1E1]